MFIVLYVMVFYMVDVIVMMEMIVCFCGDKVFVVYCIGLFVVVVKVVCFVFGCVLGFNF